MKNTDRYRKGRVELNPLFLNYQFNTLNKTKQQIANETGYAISTIQLNLTKFGIVKEKECLHRFYQLSKIDLEKLYLIDNLSTYDIAEQFNVSQNSVEKRLNYFDIAIKDSSKKIIGAKIDRLEVVSLYDRVKRGKKIKERYLCQCKCGKTKICFKQRLLDGRNTSCGCGNNTGKLNRNWDGYGDISASFFTRIINNAKKRNIEADISIKEIWELFLKQNKQCVLTGRTIGFDVNDKNKASLDRIDSNKGYFIDNIQWIHKDINIMKMALNQEYFIQLCKEVANKND